MKISDIQFEVRSFRFEEPMRVAFATITEMETCIVRVITDEGLTGYGEAAPFPYVRVDLYNIHGRIVFGELTFFPGSGLGTFTPAEYNQIIGAQLKLPEPKER